MCGSFKFRGDLIDWAEKLELEGNCVLIPIFNPNVDKSEYTSEELKLLGVMHKKKIGLSDAIFIVNKDGYIGSSTKSEIEYAKELGKEILFMENEPSCQTVLV